MSITREEVEAVLREEATREQRARGTGRITREQIESVLAEEEGSSLGRDALEVGKSFTRGVAHSPAALVEQAEVFRNIALPDSDPNAGLPPELQVTSGEMARDMMAGLTDDGVLGLHPPETAGQRIAQTVGEMTPQTALYAGVGAGAAPAGTALTAGLAEFGAGTSAVAAGGMAHEGGIGPAGQFGIETAVGAFNPAALPRAMQGLARAARPAVRSATTSGDAPSIRRRNWLASNRWMWSRSPNGYTDCSARTPPTSLLVR